MNYTNIIQFTRNDKVKKFREYLQIKIWKLKHGEFKLTQPKTGQNLAQAMLGSAFALLRRMV
jgi:hypothetical protein